MKKPLAALILLLTSYFFTSAQTAVYQKVFGGNKQDNGFDVISTSDGGYAMTGYSNSYGSGDYDAMLIKLDSNANVQWARVYGGGGDDQALQLAQTHDGGFALAGKTTSFGAGDYDAMLIKTDSAGNLSWIKSYGGALEERLLNFRETTDHGFILAGSTLSFGQGDWDMLFIKTNLNGDTVWTKILGGPNFDQGTDADQTSDGGFIFSGRIMSWGAGSNDICLVKTNSAGDTLWTRVYGGPGWDEGMKVKQTIDGGYIVTGGSTSFGGTMYDAYLNKVNSAGNLTWSKRYAGSHIDATYDVLQLADSGYIITGETESFGFNHLRMRPEPGNKPESINPPVIQPLGTDHSNVIVIRTNVNGDTLWTRTFGGSLLDESYAIIQTKDNGFMIAAYSTSFGTDSIGFYLVKLDFAGHSGCYETPAGPVVTSPPTVVSTTAIQITSGLTVTQSMNTLLTPLVTQQDICFAINLVTEPAISETRISFFPNPTETKLTIQYPSEQGNDNHFVIFDVIGQEITKGELPKRGQSLIDETELEISEWKSGIYFLRIGLFTGKIIKL